MHEQNFIRALDAADGYLTAVNELQATLKSGFFNLARARYSMGPSKICATQLPSKMTASFRVHLTRDSVPPYHAFIAHGEKQENINNRTVDDSAPADELQTRSQSRPEGVTREQSATGASGYSSLIDSLAQEFNCCDPAGESTADEECGDVPLRWFGTMVAPQLRSSQADFMTAVELVVQLANLQHQLAQASEDLTRTTGPAWEDSGGAS